MAAETTSKPRMAPKPAAPAPAKPAHARTPAPAGHATKLAVIRVRGAPKMSTITEDTLRHLGLVRAHACAIIDDAPRFRGMIRNIDSYVAWGPVSEDLIKQVEKASRLGTFAFALKSPKKGFARKGIKLPAKAKGSLGRQDVSRLITRML